MKQYLKTLDRLQRQLDIKKYEAVAEIQLKVDFEIDLTFQSGDGWCLLAVQSSDLAKLSDCLDIIKTKGALTLNDFYEIAI